MTVLIRIKLCNQKLLNLLITINYLFIIIDISTMKIETVISLKLLIKIYINVHYSFFLPST